MRETRLLAAPLCAYPGGAEQEKPASLDEESAASQGVSSHSGRECTDEEDVALAPECRRKVEREIG